MCLTDICKTRWVQRLDALEVFQDLLPAIIVTLEEIGRNMSTEAGLCKASVKANGLVRQFSTFQFLLLTFVPWLRQDGPFPTPGASTMKLQERAMDIKSAYDNMTEVSILS